MFSLKQKSNFQPKNYLIAKNIVNLVFVVGLIFIGYRLILPPKKIDINFKNLKKLSSYITLNNNSSFMDFFVVLPENFSQVKIDILTNKNYRKQNILSDFHIYKTYTAFAYPFAGEKTELKPEEIAQLIDYNGSVYIVTELKKFPIDNPLTFEAHGFQWDNIIKSDKISDFEKMETQPLFHLKDPHPDGTIFKTIDTHKFYYISDHKKYLLSGSALNYPQLKKIAIPVAEKSLTVYAVCQLHKKRFSTDYICQSNLDKINIFPGSYYRFKNTNIKPIFIDKIKIDLSYKLSLHNIYRSSFTIFHRILRRFHLISLK